MTREKSYFLSDFHLGAAYFSSPVERERHIVRFLDSIKNDADQIFLLGDILDYWYEYRFVVPKGFVRFFGKLAELADSGVRITWLVGNHDIWIFDYLPSQLGIRVIDGAVIERIGESVFYMAHGDNAGIDNWKFRFIRSLFRNKFCQRIFSGIHPRWTVPFAHSWSSSSRKKGSSADLVRLQKEAIRRLRDFSEKQLENNPEINYFLFGHLHCIYRERIAPSSEIVVLGDWINHFSFAVFSDGNLSVQTFPLD